MTQKADEVLQAGLELDLGERAAVVRRLLESLGPVDSTPAAEIDAAWARELDTRLDDVLQGRVELSTFEQTRLKARKIVDDLHR